MTGNYFRVFVEPNAIAHVSNFVPVLRSYKQTCLELSLVL